MNNIVKFLALGIGGLFLWNKFGPSTTENVSGEVEATVPTTPSSVNIKSQMMAILKQQGDPEMITYDGWNYYYQKVRGVYGPDWELAIEQLTANDPRRNRDFRMSIDDFFAMTNPLGLAGLGAYITATTWESATKRIM